jgi:hypothetical protein
MRSNTFVLAVFVLISSTLAAPLHNRPLARRSIAPRSVQAVLSKSPPARCDPADANGSSWSEELCAKMPHVTGFMDPTNGGCRRPTNVGGGTGTCYIKSDRPIPHIYRRMVPAEVLSEVASPSGPTPTVSPSSVHSNEFPTPPAAALPSSGSSDDASSTATSPDATASPPSVPSPTSTGSDESPTLPTNGSEDTKPEAPSPQTHTSSGDPQHPKPNPVPSHNKVEGAPPTTDKVSSPVTEVDAPATVPSATNEAPVAEATPAGVSPVQAPFAAPKSKAAPTSVVKEAAEGPSGSPKSTASSSKPTATTPAIPAANVPPAHGTEGTWGGTLVNTINGMRSPLAGARKGAEQKPMKLRTVIGTLFFDVVYGRFLV